MIVQEKNTDQMPAVKAHYKIPGSLQSCHTAIVDGYVVEGHVPREDILRMLREKPDIIGLSVPGMPIGSPGMEMPNRAAEPFKVISFDKFGKSKIFATYPK